MEKQPEKMVTALNMNALYQSNACPNSLPSMGEPNNDPKAAQKKTKPMRILSRHVVLLG